MKSLLLEKSKTFLLKIVMACNPGFIYDDFLAIRS